MSTTRTAALLCLISTLASARANAQWSAVYYFGSNACDMPLLVQGTPNPGGTIQIVSRGTILHAGRHLFPSYLMFGWSSTSIGGAPLPMPLANLFPGSTASCGQLLQSADWFTLMPQATQFLPTASLVIAIPNEPGLVGLSVACQTLSISWCIGCGLPRDGTASNGAWIHLGP